MMKEIYVFPNKAKDILKKIVYTNDKSKLYPSVVSHVNEEEHINLDSVGAYKNEKWGFQSEWRYKLFIIAHVLTDYPEDQLKSLKETVLEIKEGKYERTISFYDIPISDKAFSEMEITLSPKISEGNRVIVKNLVEKYNPSAKIIDSSLLGLI